MVCAVAGLTSDANILVNYARLAAQRYELTYGEKEPCEQLVQALCDYKQAYTQYGGQRPFGVSFLFAGYDHHFGFQLYHSDPSGNYGGWKATAIGANNRAAKNMLKQEYKDGMSEEDALKLAVKVMNKTMDTTAPSAEKVEFMTLTKDEDGKLIQNFMSEKDTKALLDMVAKETADEGDM